MIERIGQRISDFVGTTGVNVVRAVEEVVPLAEPARRRLVTPGRALVAAGVVAAAGIASTLRGAKSADSSSSDSSVSNSSSGSSVRANGGTATKAARAAKDVAEDLADKTRAELYALAKKADVQGRGSMSKSQLLKALSNERSTAGK